MLPSLCNIAWEWFWLSSVWKQLFAFSMKPKKQLLTLIKKQCAVIALGKDKTTGALAERWQSVGLGGRKKVSDSVPIFLILVQGN